MTSSTPLAEACRAGNIEEVLAIVQRCADATDGERHIDFQDVEGRTALHWAAASAIANIVECLLAEPRNASLLTQDQHHATPLQSACAAKMATATIGLMLRHCAAQCAAAHSSFADYVNTADDAGNTPLLSSASRNQLETVKELLAVSEVDAMHANRSGQTALHRAVGTGSEQLIQLLISHVRKAAPTQVKRFVNMKDTNGDTALHYAAMENNKELGELLLRNGADRDIRNKQGKPFYEL